MGFRKYMKKRNYCFDVYVHFDRNYHSCGDIVKYDVFLPMRRAYVKAMNDCYDTDESMIISQIYLNDKYLQSELKELSVYRKVVDEVLNAKDNLCKLSDDNLVYSENMEDIKGFFKVLREYINEKDC